MKPEDIQCPVCGYYCLGKGGVGCIDKPNIYKLAIGVSGTGLGHAKSKGVTITNLSKPKWRFWKCTHKRNKSVH